MIRLSVSPDSGKRLKGKVGKNRNRSAQDTHARSFSQISIKVERSPVFRRKRTSAFVPTSQSYTIESTSIFAPNLVTMELISHSRISRTETSALYDLMRGTGSPLSRTMRAEETQIEHFRPDISRSNRSASRGFIIIRFTAPTLKQITNAVPRAAQQSLVMSESSEHVDRVARLIARFVAEHSCASAIRPEENPKVPLTGAKRRFGTASRRNDSALGSSVNETHLHVLISIPLNMVVKKRKR